MLQYRYIWSNDRPVPEGRVVPFADLAAQLPPEHPSVSVEERRRAIAIRQRHVQRREPV